MTTITAPPAPGEGSLTQVGTDTITAAWGASSGAVNYILSISTDAANPPVSIVASSTTEALSAAVSGLTPNTTYFAWVQACAVTCSSFTALGSTVTLANLPQAAAFSNLTATQLQANWTANNNPAGTLYTAILSTAPSPGTNGLSGNLTLSGSGLSALFTGLTFSTTYYVDVQAVNFAGTGTAFVSLGSTVTLAPPAVVLVPNPPINYLGQPQMSGTQVSYRWDPVTTYSNGSAIAQRHADRLCRLYLQRSLYASLRLDGRYHCPYVRPRNRWPHHLWTDSGGDVGLCCAVCPGVFRRPRGGVRSLHADRQQFS